MNGDWLPSAHGKTSSAIRHAGTWWLLLWLLTMPCISCWWGSPVISLVCLMLVMEMVRMLVMVLVLVLVLMLVLVLVLVLVLAPSTPLSSTPITALFLTTLLVQILLLPLHIESKRVVVSKVN